MLLENMNLIWFHKQVWVWAHGQSDSRCFRKMSCRIRWGVSRNYFCFGSGCNNCHHNTSFKVRNSSISKLFDNVIYKGSMQSYKCILRNFPFLKFFDSGDHVVAMDDLYGGTNRYFRKVASRSGIETSFVDETNPANVEAAMKPNTKMVSLRFKRRLNVRQKKIIFQFYLANTLSSNYFCHLGVDRNANQSYIKSCWYCSSLCDCSPPKRRFCCGW